MHRIRPWIGLAHKYFDELLGKRLKEDLQRRMPMIWDFFDEISQSIVDR